MQALQLRWRHFSLVAQTVKRLPTMWETWVRSLDWEDPVQKEMATHSSILAWKIPWAEEPGGLQSMGPQRVRHDWATSQFREWNNTANRTAQCSPRGQESLGTPAWLFFKCNVCIYNGSLNTWTIKRVFLRFGLRLVIASCQEAS